MIAALCTDQVQLTGYQYPLVEAFRESVVHVHVVSEGNWKHRAMGISFSLFLFFSFSLLICPVKIRALAWLVSCMSMGNSGLIPLTDEECCAVGP